MPLDATNFTSFLPVEEPVEVIEDAVLKRLQLGRDRVIQGWCQNTFYIYTSSMEAGEVQYCMVGAVVSSVSISGSVTPVLDGPDHVKIMDYLFAALPIRWRFLKLEETDSKVQTLQHYNDRRDRKKQEVVEVFDRAINLYLHRHTPKRSMWRRLRFA